ncbi:hypothetical protein L227DRAFT_570707 [Lentinus tigrinus ALCF2SS1-6]|uniref:Secreted protein n=1 Tax=Lentinus tigrinus ALCF2SS1-6 TaxID=1328759 RepID=A0A5C2SQI7_9APHY|nr:hypothetical protein L227DRAFT_570707 [Lentinus tigrinus ALCF2SS1-6]
MRLLYLFMFPCVSHSLPTFANIWVLDRPEVLDVCGLALRGPREAQGPTSMPQCVIGTCLSMSDRFPKSSPLYSSSLVSTST